MKQDNVEVEILPDGTIKLTSDPISAPNHVSATEFFKTVGRLSGGEIKTMKRKDKKHVHHTHDHDHEHQ